MSVTRDVDVDRDGDAIVATIVERRELRLPELFDENDEIRLWQYEDGWTGFERADDGYYLVDTRRDDWLRRFRVGERSLIDVLRSHVKNPAAGGRGYFERSCSP